MNLENRLNEKKPDTKDHMLHDSTYMVSTVGKPIEIESRFVVARGRGRGE